MRLRAAHVAAFILFAAPLWVAALPSSAGTGNQQPAGAGQNASPAPASSAPPSEANPFPSPTPTPTPGPIGNGFVLLGVNEGNGSGGIIPSTSATPSPFPGSSGTGFFVNIAGRFSTSFTALLRFDDYAVHGGDSPVVTRSDGELFYTPRGGVLGAGLGYGSLQRSSNRAAANAIGLGACLLPNLRQTVSPYATLFFYPSATTQGASAGVTTFAAGIVFQPRSSHFLIQLGYDYMSYPNQNSSPTSLGGLQAGLGASF